MNTHLKLRFTGEHIKPTSERAHDIGEIISAFEEAIAIIVARRHPQLKRESVTISLVGVEHKSVGLVFEPNLEELVFPAIFDLMEAIQDKAWALLPYGTLNALRKILRFVNKRECVAQLSTAYGDRAISTILTPDTIIPSSVSLFGETQVYGEVKRVGGSEPKVELRTLQGETLYCTTSEEIAKQLGSRLYEQVGVYGVAEWNFETLEIEEFEITRVLHHFHITPKEAFKNYRNLSVNIFLALIM